MAYIEKLRIQGFRSFGPMDSDMQRMRFTTLEAAIRRSKAKKARNAGEGDTQQHHQGDKETKVWPLTLILVIRRKRVNVVFEC